MRKIIFNALFLMITISASAQIKNFIGVKGGVNFSNFNSSYPSKTQVGVIGGLAYTLKLPGLVAIEADILYAQQGAEVYSAVYTDTTLSIIQTFDGNVKMNYLQVPLLLKMYIPIPGIFSPSIVIGPAFSFLSGAKRTGTRQEIDTTETVLLTDQIDSDITSNYNSMDVSGIIGLSFDFELPVRLTFDFRYLVGLSGLEKGIPTSIATKKTAWTLMLGASINLNGGK